MTTDNPTDTRIRRRTRRCHPNPSAHPRETGKTDGGISHDGRDGRCSDFASSIVWRETEQLKPNAGNARTHSKKQIRQIAASIREFGFTNPVLIDAEDMIIAGHGRVEAAKVLRLDTVPTLLIDHLTEDQKRAYIIADNRLAELAGWDETLLAIEFQHLTEIEVNFEVEITGFETAEIDLLIERAEAVPDDDADALPDIDETTEPVSRHGDLWRLGPHRLLCDDALDLDCYARLMAGEQAQLVFTDPPYNVPIDGNVCGSGRIRHREFVMASGEMSEAEFTAFLRTALSNLAASSKDGAIHFICMDWRHAYVLMTAGREVYSELKNVCVWNKSNGGMGTFYRSKHELVFVFKNGTARPINNFELGQHGRYRTNVWDYPGVNSLRAGRLEELAMHPTLKPVALVADAIRDCSKRNGRVLDAFAGSGTTIIAAARTGRIGYGLELDPRYVDVAVRRWMEFSGEAAIHDETCLPFDVMADRRRTEPAHEDPGDATRACLAVEQGHV